MFKARINKLMELRSDVGVEAFYVTRPQNRFYLSGFTGTAGALLLCGSGAFLLTDFRYLEQAKQQSPHLTIVDATESLMNRLDELVRENNVSRLGYDGDHLSHNEFLRLKDKLVSVNLTATSGLVEKLRLIKDSTEIKHIEEAVRLSDRAFEQVRPHIKPGVTEREIGLRLDFAMREMGAEGVAFETIVASGPRSALPHGVASSKRLQKGDLVIMDFGSVYCGYHSDITRTIVVGELAPWQREIYSIVLEAQLKAIEAIRHGVKASAVDSAARYVITSKGYGDYFGHGTGHGLGLDIHENPRLSRKVDTVLQAGMVVTVEPGIYLPGQGGVRIEDTVIVLESGCRVLTQTPKMRLEILS
ncbi:MAG: Xaa-Pro peptidase family protein [Desulfotomaculaceae bacterium]|nr:Xaa-Pro peptidase family protein [Desulfotomaculaceae bacterium]